MTIPDVAIGPFGWTCIVVAAWLIVAVGAGIPIGRAINRAELADHEPVPEVVNWLPYLPPVPPTQAEIDATWLDDQPTDVWLTDELASRLCREILAIEGLSS